MELIFDFNSSWYILFFAFVASWAILLLLRRNHIEKEIREQIFIGTSGLMSMVVLELFAVSVGLWEYMPGNWPVILWPTYIAAILFGYQLLRSIETLLHKPLIPSQLK